MITITRTKILGLTAAAAALYTGLGIAFANDHFTGTFLDADALAGSSAVSWLLLGAIVVAGLLQASRLPADGVPIGARRTTAAGAAEDPAWWRLLLTNGYLAVLWMPLRFFVGGAWLAAGEQKLRNAAWMDGGTALRGYWESAVAVPAAPESPAITYGWYRDILQYMLDNAWYTWFAKVVAIGEFLVGLGLIVGALVGIAAFFGTLLNFNFMLAGSVSSNPVLFALGVLLILGWKVAGRLGLDRVLLPALGTPWQGRSLRAPSRRDGMRRDRLSPRHPRTA